jgi:hypothetical protein
MINLRNDFETIRTGKDKYDVLIDSTKVGDFIVTHERRRDGSLMFGMETYYRYYTPSGEDSYRSTATVWKTFDEAVLGGLAHKYDGLNSQAAGLIANMLDIDAARGYLW